MARRGNPELETETQLEKQRSTTALRCGPAQEQWYLRPKVTVAYSPKRVGISVLPPINRLHIFAVERSSRI